MHVLLYGPEVRQSAIGMVLAVVQSGWMMYSVKARSHHFIVVSTMAGATTHIAITLMTSPSPATVACLHTP